MMVGKGDHEGVLTSSTLYWYFTVFCYRKCDSFVGEIPFGCFQIPLILAENFKQDVDRYI
jgi:hypothetical protein